jgi:hypothetical protein
VDTAFAPSWTKQSTKHGKALAFKLNPSTHHNSACGHYFINSQASIEYLYLTCPPFRFFVY